MDRDGKLPIDIHRLTGKWGNRDLPCEREPLRISLGKHESKPIPPRREMEGPKPDPAQLTSIAIQKHEYKKLHNVPN
ncbi:hypothetical protein D5086_024800 [Populus alba]|uniref:Uncharacterized protein n=1 Tax=Populus alba TaxID=43335 RepID=A0ACC4B6X2_POPAL